MTYLFCVDPGLRGCGAALFREGHLWRASYVKNPTTEGRGYQAYATMGHAVWNWSVKTPRVEPITRQIIELPRIYPHAAQQKGDPNDLIDVACVGAAIAAMFGGVPTETVFPSDWKGQVPKEIMTERIKSKLSHTEMALVELVGAKDHNTFDAVGIGLHHLGRLGKRVFG